MSHANAPFTPEGRLRLVRRCAHRPIAHVAAEAGISRQCLSKWKARFEEFGEVGLADRASVPHTSPTQLDRPNRGKRRRNGDGRHPVNMPGTLRHHDRR